MGITLKRTIDILKSRLTFASVNQCGKILKIIKLISIQIIRLEFIMYALYTSQLNPLEQVGFVFIRTR